jgi:predicted MFS family arabinose efflux permease
VSLVLAPVLAAAVGLAGLFGITGILALLGVAVVLWGAPPAPDLTHQAQGRLGDVLRHPDLMRLNLGVFVLHAVQLAMWVAIPALLVQAGLPKDQHWQVYLPAVLASFVLMGGMFALERRGHLKKVFLASIALIALVQLGLLLQASGTVRLWPLAGLLFAFFCGFNILEATQPSMVSRLAPAPVRGAAMGVFNTLQSLGFFVGGWLGGSLLKSWGSQGLFLCCAGAMLAWWLLALPMQAPGRTAPAQQDA